MRSSTRPAHRSGSGGAIGKRGADQIRALSLSLSLSQDRGGPAVTEAAVNPAGHCCCSEASAPHWPAVGRNLAARRFPAAPCRTFPAAVRICAGGCCTMSDRSPWQAGLATERDLAEPIAPAAQSPEAGVHIPVEDRHSRAAGRRNPAAAGRKVHTSPHICGDDNCTNRNRKQPARPGNRRNPKGRSSAPRHRGQVIKYA